MILGSGLIARGFEKIAHKHQEVIFLCSGVSGSTVVTAEACAREKVLITNSIKLHDKIFVYTSSLSCLGNSPYDKHKLDIENLISTAKRFLIIRVGHVIGQGHNSWQFFPSIVNQVKAGRVVVMKTRRDIVDLMDYVLFTDQLLNAGCDKLITSFGSLYPPKVIQIIEYLEQKFGSCDKIMIDGSGNYAQPDFVILNKDYYKSVIDKFIYETDSTLDNRGC